jgi:hypothetical protein
MDRHRIHKRKLGSEVNRRSRMDQVGQAGNIAVRKRLKRRGR